MTEEEKKGYLAMGIGLMGALYVWAFYLRPITVLQASPP